MVLIYKGVGNLCVIALVEMLFMVAKVLINCPFTASIDFHNILHGFQAGHGTGTAYLETKLVQ